MLNLFRNMLLTKSALLRFINSQTKVTNSQITITPSAIILLTVNTRSWPVLSPTLLCSAKAGQPSITITVLPRLKKIIFPSVSVTNTFQTEHELTQYTTTSTTITTDTNHIPTLDTHGKPCIADLRLTRIGQHRMSAWCYKNFRFSSPPTKTEMCSLSTRISWPSAVICPTPSAIIQWLTKIG